MFFQPKNVPIVKTKINADKEIINDNNNTENSDLIIKDENEINDQTIVGKNDDKKKYFIYVDPLDDFGAATVARKKCAKTYS